MDITNCKQNKISDAREKSKIKMKEGVKVTKLSRDGELLELRYIDLARSYSPATLLEAAEKMGALSSGIKPLSNHFHICGPALPVSSPPGDNLTLHEAITLARPGDVLVVDTSGEYEAGYWGDIMTHAAQERGVQGLVIDGCVRDYDNIIQANFPVFSRGLCIRGTTKKGGGTINEPIKMGEVTISTGDLIVGNSDGVVVIPNEKVSVVLENAKKREDFEEKIREEIKNGKTTMEIYGWKPSKS
jgi:4-hydroxy-4-methyl-2-oxoglutarate aldolase